MSDHIMTPELRKLLLSRVPFSPAATIEYTPTMYTTTKDENGNDIEDNSLPSEFVPVFVMKTMSKADKDAVTRNRCKKVQDDYESEKLYREIVRKCVVGWRNLFDASAVVGEEIKPIEYKSDVDGGVDKSIFDNLPVQAITDLFIYISGVSGLRLLDRSGL